MSLRQFKDSDPAPGKWYNLRKSYVTADLITGGGLMGIGNNE